MFNRKLSRASLGLALSAALGAASLAFAQEPSASSYVRGASRFAAGDFAQATADFDAAIAARSEDPRVYYFRGLCAARQNDPATAAQFYATGARLEIETPQGRLVAVDAALKTIQGAERAPIEAARAKARADWKAKEADRQNALYGESLNRQRARLATPPQTTAASKPAAGEALAFPSIRPFFRGETPAHQAPDPYDPNSDKFNYFREDLGKTSLSTRELKRLQELAERDVYEDPMDRPAADGSPFVNIYDPSEVFVEDAPYASADDPDVLYEADEKNALNAMAVGCRLGAAALAQLSGSNAANGYGSGSGSSPYGSSSYGSSSYDSSGYPGGPGSSDAAPKAVEPSKSDDTAKIFKGDEKPANPFGGKLELDKNNDFDLFPTGRDFKPTAPAPTDPYASGGYSSGGPH